MLPREANPSILEALGKRVRALRRQRGLSQEELAKLAGLHRTYIGGVERGERNPTLTSMERIAAALKVSVRTLLEEV